MFSTSSLTLNKVELKGQLCIYILFFNFRVIVVLPLPCGKTCYLKLASNVQAKGKKSWLPCYVTKKL